MFSPQNMPQSMSTLFSTYASFAASMMLIRSMANEVVPHELRYYLSAAVRYFFTPVSNNLTLVIDETGGIARNELYAAAETYLPTRMTPSSTETLRISKTPRQKNISVSIDRGQDVHDEFDEVKLKWTYVCTEKESKNEHVAGREERCFQLSFDKKFKEKVMGSYLPFVLRKAKEIKEQEKTARLYSRECSSRSYDEDGEGGGGGEWGSVKLEHPATFDTLAMDPDVKKMIIDDMDRFVRRREFYKKVGKAWKRGYLLYGPPGTGKSSLIAAMANHLKFDIFDLELTSIYSNSDLRRVLLSTTNRSILVIEDIDCSVDIKDRQNGDDSYDYRKVNTKLTLSGLLNFIDGLWSSCGDERIIVLTTNHKDRLDPALLRPGRMDVHVNLSYCTSAGFSLLASNYLGIHNKFHPLNGEIEALIKSINVTPAEIAEQLMTSEIADVALEGLAKFLKRKKAEVEGEEGCKVEGEDGGEANEKRLKCDPVENKLVGSDSRVNRDRILQALAILRRRRGRRRARGKGQ